MGAKCIYALVDPRTDAIRYIGMTSLPPETRMLQHLKQAVGGGTHKCHWLCELLRVGEKPRVEVLELLGDTPWQEREKWWIAHGRAEGWPLTNTTHGGDGRVGCAHTTETRAKMSVAQRAVDNPGRFCVGYKHSADALARITEASRHQKPQPSESVERSRRAKIGKPLSDEHKAAISAKLTGRKIGPMPEEQKAKIRAANSGKVRTAETNAAQSARSKAWAAEHPDKVATAVDAMRRAQTPEVRAKQRDALRRYYAEHPERKPGRAAP